MGLKSSEIQQRCLALNTIANILQIYNAGIYDDIFELPIEQIFFVIRHSLDENNHTIVCASLKCLMNMFYFEIDEECLDSLLGFNLGLIQPCLESDKQIIDDNNKKVKDNELNDQQVAESDLIKCLLRTNILIRIRYILINFEIPPEAILSCLNLLLRIARDSFENCSQLIKFDLFDTFFKILLQKSTNFHSIKCKISIIKMLRVICTKNGSFLTELLIKKNPEIFNSILCFISEDALNKNLIKLQIEMLFLIATILRYNNGQEIPQMSILKSVLLKILNYHFKNTNTTDDCSYLIHRHASSMICILTQIQDQDFLYDFLPLLNRFYEKTSNQTMKLQIFKCGFLQILTSLLVFWALHGNNSCNLSIVQKLIHSDGFNNITTKILYGSNLCCKYSAHSTNSAFDSVQASVWDSTEHLIPILNSLSCMPFLTALSKYLLEYKNIEVMLSFLRHQNLIKYLKKLNQMKMFYLTNNWFTTRVECELLINCFLLAHHCVARLTEDEKLLIYQLLIKTIFLFTLEQKSKLNEIFVNIVFNKSYFPIDQLISKLSIATGLDLFNKLIGQIEDIKFSYLIHLQLHTTNHLPSNYLTLRNHPNGILPTDWMYLPIIYVYSNNENGEKNITIEFKKIIVRSLKWLIILENLFPTLIDSILSVTSRFCRLGCVFLCSNDLFFDVDINECFNCLFKSIINRENYSKLDFDSDIKGLTKFQDFYKQLLEQYQAVSYGDELFANYILIPLARKFNPQLKKIVFSEYADVLRTVVLKEDQVLLPINEFLHPKEMDNEVLELYKKVLDMGYLNRSPFLKKVVQHHLDI